MKVMVVTLVVPDTGNPHLTPVSVGGCSRARVCVDRCLETQRFVDPGTFAVTDAGGWRPPRVDYIKDLRVADR